MEVHFHNIAKIYYVHLVYKSYAGWFIVTFYFRENVESIFLSKTRLNNILIIQIVFMLRSLDRCNFA